jgi:hypothetical protein
MDRERPTLYASSLFIRVFSQTVILDSDEALGENMHLSLGGLALVAILVITWRILLGSYDRRAESIEVCVKRSADVHANPSPTVTLTWDKIEDVWCRPHR